MEIRVTIQSPGGTGEYTGSSGKTVGELLADFGYPIAMPCGGKGRCGQCRVKAAGKLEEPGVTERRVLGGALKQGYRLACVARAQGNILVELEKAPRNNQILREGWQRPFPRDPVFREWGAAVDIGTTTISGMLLDREGRAAEASCPNPQERFGADVISRMEQAMAGQSEALSEDVRRAVRELLQEMCVQLGVAVESVEKLVITGNTAMLYLLCGVNPEPLTHAPFLADRLFGEWVQPETLDLPIGGEIYLPRCISAFVGADITTAVLASGMLESDETAMLADIGTNGEVALWHRGKLLCCSTAAGPAFEGAGIRMGMQAAEGAIDRVMVEYGDLAVTTIGGAVPKGICGSGVIDAVAALLDLGLLDENGLIDEEHELLSHRVYELEGEISVSFAKGVALTQRDIRMVQLAKSAIRAGMETLLREAGITAGDLDTLYIAGGFGHYMNAGSAVRIGLIPGDAAEKIRVIGNAAQTGAGMLLQNRTYLAQSREFANGARTVELASHRYFVERYVQEMLF